MTSKIVVNNIEPDAGISTVSILGIATATKFIGDVEGGVTGNVTATSFTGIKRSQFDTSYVFETSLEPFKNSGGVVNSYQKGYSVQQYWAYSTDPSGEASQSGSSSSNVNYGGLD